MLTKIDKSILSVFIIILLAIVLRFVNLSKVPVGFNDDEAAFGYNAYSILKTGRDEWGRFLPFPVFESFGDWKLVGYLYPTVISEFIFGPNEFATRFPSALFGTLAVLSTYLLASKLFNKKTGIFSALLLSISPWHIAAARNAFESDILIFFITLSTYFFLKIPEKLKFLYFSFFGFVLCFYIYRSAWLFVPIFLTLLIFTNRLFLKKHKSQVLKIAFISILLLVPLVPTIFTFKGQSRFFQESFVTGIQSQGIIDEANERRGFCQKDINSIICKLVYNKYNFYLLTYINNYFTNLSPQTYYLVQNGTGYQSFPSRSFFYTSEFPLAVLGFIFLLKSKNTTARNVLIAWFLIVPIGASVTGIGNPGRLNILMPVPQIIEAFGLLKIYDFFKSKKLKLAFAIVTSLVFIFSVSRLVFDMYFKHPQVSARYQRYGYSQLFTYIENVRRNYDEVMVSRKGDDAKQYIHYLFSQKYDPKKYLETIGPQRYRGEDSWIRVDKIENIQFVPSVPEPESINSNSLLVISHNETIYPNQPIFVVKDFRDDAIFEVYDGDQLKIAQKEYEEEIMRLKLLKK